MSTSEAAGLYVGGTSGGGSQFKSETLKADPINHIPGHKRRRGDNDSGGSSSGSLGGSRSGSNSNNGGSSGSSLGGGGSSGSSFSGSNNGRPSQGNGGGSSFGGGSDSSSSFGGSNNGRPSQGSGGGSSFGGNSNGGSSFSGGSNNGGSFDNQGSASGRPVGVGEGQARPKLQRQDNVPKGLAAGYDPSAAPGGGVERKPYDTPVGRTPPSGPNTLGGTTSPGLDAFNRQYPPPAPRQPGQNGSLNNQYDGTNTPLGGSSSTTDAGGLDAFNRQYPPPPPPGQRQAGSLNNQYDGPETSLGGGQRLPSQGLDNQRPAGNGYVGDNQRPAGDGYANANGG
ncbi:MAG: hypothetical protein AB8B94_13925, partial [Hyphomicrobiales bacterium]